MAVVPMFGGEDRLTIKAGVGGVTAGMFVKCSGWASGYITAAKAVATGGADAIAADAADADDLTTAIMLAPGTVIQVLAEAGVAAGDPIKVSANGKAATATAPTDNGSAGDDGFLIVGRALTATSSGEILALIR